MNRSIHGGRSVDFAPIDLAPRRWPKVGKGKPTADDPRSVRIKITSWVGLSLGAKHTYVEIEEEFNPLWDEKEQAWRQCWDDTEGTGIKGKFSVETEEQAWAIVKATIKACGFDQPGYQIHWHIPDRIAQQVKQWKAIKWDGD